jgi:hypothetical protein
LQRLSNLSTNFNFLINYIPESKNYIKEVESYNTLIDDYVKVKEFFYKYPKYLYQTFDGKKEINDQTFIHLNIYDIFKPENEQYRIKLIYYYANLWFDYRNDKIIKYEMGNRNKNDFKINLIINLQLLIYKYCSNNYKEKIGHMVNKKNIFSTEEFDKELLNIANNIIKKNDINPKHEFCDYIVENRNTLLDKNLFIQKLMKKYISDITFDGSNNIFINSQKFISIRLEDNNLLRYLFDIYDNSYYLINELTTNPRSIYIINENMCVNINCDILDIKKSVDKNIRINSIKYNNNEVIKYQDLNLPFKNVIPTNCFHLIYNLNNIYHITYFKKKNSDYYEKSNLLGNCIMTDGIYTFTINPNNLFFFNKMDKEQFDNLVILCKNYQINKYNILYIHNYDNPKDNGYYSNSKYLEIMDFNWKNFQSQPITEELRYSSTNFINYTDVSMNTYIQFEYIKKELLHCLDKTTNKYESIMHLLNKISKCSFIHKIK